MKRCYGLVGTALLAAAAVCFGGTTERKPLGPKAGDGLSGQGGKEIQIKGTFFWEKKKNNVEDIRIVLTPTGADAYDAVYSFKWNKKDMTWKGTIKGNLKNGEVSGDGGTPDGSRTFVFTGKARNGVIACKHSETTKGRAGPTGEMTLTLM